jgi:hypothetical protein
MAEDVYGLAPQRAGVGMRAFVIARFVRSAGADLPVVRNHRIVPGGEARAQRRRLRRSDPRSKCHVRIHVSPPSLTARVRHTIDAIRYAASLLRHCLAGNIRLDVSRNWVLPASSQRD